MKAEVPGWRREGAGCRDSPLRVSECRGNKALRQRALGVAEKKWQTGSQVSRLETRCLVMAVLPNHYSLVKTHNHRQCRRPKRYGFDPWVRKTPWSKEWQPTPIFLPGKFEGQRSLVGCSSWGRRVRHNYTHGHSLHFLTTYYAQALHRILCTHSLFTTTDPSNPPKVSQLVSSLARIQAGSVRVHGPYTFPCTTLSIPQS